MRAVSLPDASRATDRKNSIPQLRQETTALRDFGPADDRRHRNILKELHIRESKILHTTMFDALMKNCFFYISRMYEFLHRLD
jgi:hypothetical protein